MSWLLAHGIISSEAISGDFFSYIIIVHALFAFGKGDLTTHAFSRRARLKRTGLKRENTLISRIIWIHSYSILSQALPNKTNLNNWIDLYLHIFIFKHL